MNGSCGLIRSAKRCHAYSDACAPSPKNSPLRNCRHRSHPNAPTKAPTRLARYCRPDGGVAGGGIDDGGMAIACPGVRMAAEGRGGRLLEGGSGARAVDGGGVGGRDVGGGALCVRVRGRDGGGGGDGGCGRWRGGG